MDTIVKGVLDKAVPLKTGEEVSVMMTFHRRDYMALAGMVFSEVEVRVAPKGGDAAQPKTADVLVNEISELLRRADSKTGLLTVLLNEQAAALKAKPAEPELFGKDEGKED